MNVSNSLQAICLKINGVERKLTIEPRVSLLDALRDHLGLQGTKKGCNQGACGACTVLVDGGAHQRLPDVRHAVRGP